MKKWIAGMFGSPFILVGLISLWVAFSHTLDFWRTQYWQPAPVEQLIEKNTDPRTRYAYLFNGVVYIGVRNEVRVQAIRYSDALASHESPFLKARLEHMGQKRKGATLFVNPDKPTRAVLAHKAPLKKIAISSSFGLIFCLIGAGVIYLVCQMRPPPTHWSEAQEWQTVQIHCQTKSGLFCPWLFVLVLTGFGGLMCVFQFGKAWDEGARGGAIFMLLFPLFGFFFLPNALKRSLDYSRFGTAEFHMKPSPGIVGDRVGGAVKIPRLLVGRWALVGHSFDIVLRCLDCETWRSGEATETTKSTRWEQGCRVIAERSFSGVALPFAIDVPQGLPQSDADTSKQAYVAWELEVSAEFSGISLKRLFSIPVIERQQTATATRQPAPVLA